MFPINRILQPLSGVWNYNPLKRFKNDILGARNRIFTPLYIGCNVKTGDDCIIGCNVTIDDNAIIGNNVVVGDHAVIGESVYVADNVFVPPFAIIPIGLRIDHSEDIVMLGFDPRGYPITLLNPSTKFGSLTGPYLVAGCRVFPLEQARGHWLSYGYRVSKDHIYSSIEHNAFCRPDKKPGQFLQNFFRRVIERAEYESKARGWQSRRSGE